MQKTAESVTPLHPDKICDQVSDAVLDGYLEQDPKARVALESMGKGNDLYVVGEITSTADVDIPGLIRKLPLGLEDYDIKVNLSKQSTFIAQGVDTGGAGDQGIMVGYATAETEEMMPREVILSRNLARKIFNEEKQTDGKTQVTTENDEVVTVVASFQNISSNKLAEIVRAEFPDAEKIHTNPAGDWQVGGFVSDAGLTGRKIAVDSYGPGIPVGGGAFSGKDPSKVDRSGAYMSRKIAVDFLKSKGAKEVYVYLAYSIGVAEPVQAVAVIDGVEEVVTGYDLRPNGIIEFLDLRKPQYFKTAQWGHFGNGFKWDY
ncbi:methionine adenosyltransferase domain-containing protein [Candidatus Dojkabacteria bacterium]|nr:methionine adenosyltransferase domain-containing protein [Candidatus Dojkabacteria bacterium]